MRKEQKVVDNIIDYKSVFCNEKGMQVLWDLMKTSGYTSSNFDPNPYQTAYNEGLRSMVIRIITLIGMDVMQIEAEMKKQREKDKIYGDGDII